MKKTIFLLLCLAMITCSFAGCSDKKEDETIFVNTKTASADVIGMSNSELRAAFGDNVDLEYVDGSIGLEFYNSKIQVVFNLPFESKNDIPSNYYVKKVLFGERDAEVISGIKAGASYSKIKSDKRFTDVSELEVKVTGNDGEPLAYEYASATVQYNGRTLLMNMKFDTDTLSLVSGSIEIYEPADEISTDAEPTT